MQIIPKPLHFKTNPQKAVIGKKTLITGDFATEQAKCAQYLLRFDGGENTKLSFVQDSNIAKEGYILEVADNQVQIKASGEAGAFYAVMSLLQLADDKGEVQGCIIEDKPQFEYRGFMLDCARHYWSMQKIKQYLDCMASIKMNRFHIHLTDDQGWRVEIKKYPKLTQIGAKRSSTQLKWAKTEYKKVETEYKEYGEGLFYSQKELKELVEYAKERHIEIVPEIDMPGHMVAAIACYPELSCFENETQVSTRWGVRENICCCGKDLVYDFAKDIIDELCEIFPYEMFHIGGDEVPKKHWKNCKACQAKISELGLKDENALQGYFNNEIAKYLKSKGKRMVGWNEILDAQDIMDSDIVAQWWVNHSIANNQEKKWLQKGGDLIVSYYMYIYMDHPYNVRPLSKTYSLSYKLLGDVDKQHILGYEIPQWTEYIRNEEKLDMLTVARLIAFSEVCWTQESQKDYLDFENRLESKREFFNNLGCRVCPQRLYQGKVKPWHAFTNALRWRLWRKDVDYEYNQIKKEL